MRYCAVFCCCDATLASCCLSILIVVRVASTTVARATLVGGHPEIPAASVASGLAVANQAYPFGTRACRGGSLRRAPWSRSGLTNACICGYPCIVRRWASIPNAPETLPGATSDSSDATVDDIWRSATGATQGGHAVVAYRMGRGPEVAPGQRRGRHARIPCVSTSVRWPPRGVA